MCVVLIRAGSLRGEEELCQVTPQSFKSERLNTPIKSQPEMCALALLRDGRAGAVSEEEPRSSDKKLRLTRPAGRNLLQTKGQTGLSFWFQYVPC